jgi:hypothetical protein
MPLQSCRPGVGIRIHGNDLIRGFLTTSLEEGLTDLLREHRLRYPHIQIQDVYKLLHQAVFGSGHAIPDVAQARAWLETEASHLGPSFESPLIEPISPRGGMLRVHLRPYLALTADLEPLFSCFVRTATDHHGSLEEMNEWVTLVSPAAHRAGLSFPVADFQAFMQNMQILNFPAIHHSEIYVRHYQPAYRVVAARFIKSVLAVCR